MVNTQSTRIQHKHQETAKDPATEQPEAKNAEA